MIHKGPRSSNVIKCCTPAYHTLFVCYKSTTVLSMHIFSIHTRSVRSSWTMQMHRQLFLLNTVKYQRRCNTYCTWLDGIHGVFGISTGCKWSLISKLRACDVRFLIYLNCQYMYHIILCTFYGTRWFFGCECESYSRLANIFNTISGSQLATHNSQLQPRTTIPQQQR
jgi:hypothetical protein